MKICNVITSVTKYREYRCYQNTAEFSEMAKAWTLTFNANSAVNLHLCAMVHHRLTHDTAPAGRYR